MLYKIGYPLLKAYWFIRRPTTTGVRCVIFHDQHLLLIKHTYGSPLLTTVGGGIKPGETPRQAAVREVNEEVGLELCNLQQVGSLTHTSEFKKDTIYVFSAESTDKQLHIDPDEIKEAEWFDINNLPSTVSPLFKEFYLLVHAKK